jgi:hypothetical protein
MNTFNRREILIKLAKVLAFLPFASFFITACKKRPAQETPQQNSIAVSCIHEVPLSHEQIVTRKNLGYTDQTPISTRTCDNCKLYTNPVDNSACGGCLVLSGPIHPKGYCKSWVARF